jgi:glycosidase
MVGGEDHGRLRADFPGGFPDDSLNAFLPEGRSKDENDIFNFIKQLLELRKKVPELSIGKLLHFPPERGIYVFFKTLDDQKTMVIVNDRDEKREIKLSRFSEQLKNAEYLENLLAEEENISSENAKIIINSNSVSIYKIKY